MAIDNLSWPVQIQDGNTATYKRRVTSVQFGSGYEQINDDGPNSETVEYPLSFTGVTTESVDNLNPLKLLAFLRAHVIKPFTFTPPHGDTGLYRVQEGTITCRPDGYNVVTVSATLITSIGV